VNPPPIFDFIDLFAGIGGLRQAFEFSGGRCVFSSEWDRFARETYSANFPNDDHEFAGDIREVPIKAIPPHDVLIGGFPCQPFSLAGVSKKNSLGRLHGFEDETQGTLFFEILKILKARRPSVVFLENVPNLKSHDQGNTFEVVINRLTGLGYRVVSPIVSSSPWVPQARRRIVIVGFLQRGLGSRSIPEEVAMVVDSFSQEVLSLPKTDRGKLRPPPRMSTILHSSGRRRDRSLGPSFSPSSRTETAWYTDSNGNVNPKYTISPALWDYLQSYADKHRAAGNGFGFGLVGPDDVARTLSARYYKDGAEILVRQESPRQPRRLTPRECARLMGFSDNFKIPVSDNQAYKQFGNSVVVPMMEAAVSYLLPAIETYVDLHRNRKG
jgi:DNA (cytosine-5)-methyltransferase 1